MKVLSTILISLTILCSIMVGVTATEHLKSLSAYALADNVLWYRLMHITAIMFFMLNKNKNKYNLFVGFGMGLILAFDMYHFHIIHNVVTVGTLLLAAFSLIEVARGLTKKQMIMLSVAAVSVFCVGFFTNFRHLTAEIIAMAILMNGKLLEIYKDE